MAPRRKRWVMLAVVVVAAAAAVAVATTRAPGGAAEKGDTGPEIPVLAARTGDVQVVVREIGTVEPEVKVEIKSSLSGRIVDLPVRAGDRVERGQLIARIEPDVNQAQSLLGVKSTLDDARIAMEDARAEAESARALFDQGLVSVELHRQAETRLKQREQAFAAARASIAVVEASGIPVGDNPRQVVNITAPMAGVVIERPVELGETVTGSGSFNAGTVIATVAELGSMIVEAGVNEVDIGRIHQGQEVSVSLDAFPRQRFPGTIQRIAPAARLDNQVKVFDVEIALEELGRELRTGMTANIEVRGETRTGVLSVPVESVFLCGDEEVVYVKRATPLPAESADGDAAEPWRSDPRQEWRRFFEERTVRTGVASTSDVEVLDGLAEGEEVALADPTRPQEERRS